MDMMLGMDIPKDTKEYERERLGLNDPLYIQYFRFVGNALHGDLGTSIFSGKPVVEELAKRFPKTLTLAVGGTLFGAAVGVLLGIIAAIHRNKFADNLIMVLSLLPCSSLIVLHARINRRIQQVNQRIDQHKRHRQHQHSPLNRGIIAVADRIDDETPDAGNREHRFHQRCAGEQSAKAQTDGCQHGNQRVLKRMTIGNHALRHAAGTRRADIILMDNVQHRAARGARNAADCLQAKGGNRENSSLPCIHADTWQPP